jgi:hypothetical protein
MYPTFYARFIHTVGQTFCLELRTKTKQSASTDRTWNPCDLWHKATLNQEELGLGNSQVFMDSKEASQFQT